jgi:tetratricopeptide (TPR) repeat protein
MKHHNTLEAPLEQPLAHFLNVVRKVISIQVLLVTLVLVTLSLTIGSIFLGLEYVAALSVALTILSGLSVVLSSAYFHDIMKKKALTICQEIVQKSSPKHPQDAEASAKALTNYAQSMDIKGCDLVHLQHLPKSLTMCLNRFIRSFSWKYVHDFTELLFLASLDQSIAYTKANPLSMHSHACLANCYVMLARHYTYPRTLSPHLPWPRLWISEHHKLLLQTKNRMAAKAAVEELSILKTFAPDELWVHDQLAISYKELNMPKEEIHECEEIIRLCPEDQGAQLRLGILYFQLGLNAKGLIIYERLKAIYPLLSEELISHYGSYQPFLQEAEGAL